MGLLALGHALADLTARILNQNAALRAFHEDDKGDQTQRQRSGDHQDCAAADAAAGAALIEQRLQSTRGNSATMPAKMISDTPLPTPRAVICSPSQSRNITPPTSVTVVVIRKNAPGSITDNAGLRLQADRDEITLHGRKEHGQVTRILVDLTAALLAFFLDFSSEGMTAAISCMMIDAEI